ncbi:hypothetical protein ABW20_dc0107866 [Dactylellina cionopaga]|nr:hypothetical protein ABW20_dc0107866 [Dactylellina cionopaga]
MSDEFPLLEGLGLYASDIIGDGDCLFRSFSDQLYGHQGKAHEIRLRTTSYMRTHASYFKLFLSVAPPTRKTRNSSTKIPTEDAVDRAFIEHVSRMEKAGVYGDNLEIVAFARCYSVDVKIYQSENVDGPHKGLPNVTPKALTEEGKKKQKDIMDKGAVIMPWMEKVVEASLPGFVPKQKIREMLEKCKGDVNLAVSKLLDAIEDEDGDGKDAELTKEEETVNKIEESTIDAIGEPRVGHTAKGKPNGKAQKRQTRQGAQTGNKADTAAGKPQKPQNHPKRETARERKDRLQREKMDRKKTKASGSAASSTSKETNSKVSEGIKTLHV